MKGMEFVSNFADAIMSAVLVPVHLRYLSRYSVKLAATLTEQYDCCEWAEQAA
jgi:hypothetical protein